MKRLILLLIILFVRVFSYAQYDFLKESLNSISSAPSYLVIKVKSPSYEGEAVINSNYFYFYYREIVKKNKPLKREKYCKLVYCDIKQGRNFIVSDNDLIKYHFNKIIVNDSILDIAKKGINFFINTYFYAEILKPLSSLNEPFDFYTIVKVLFDTGIQTGIDCLSGDYCIQDLRFYTNDGIFVIPPEYKDSGSVPSDRK